MSENDKLTEASIDLGAQIGSGFADRLSARASEAALAAAIVEEMQARNGPTEERPMDPAFKG